MKSYNGLFDRMTKLDEIEASIMDASQHKRQRRAVKQMLANLPTECKRIQNEIINDTYIVPTHTKVALCEGAHKKKRQIVKPWFRDEQVIHHILMRQLKPIIIPRMYANSYGSLPDRGSLKAQQVMTRWRDEYGRKKFYVAELDLHHFYASIDTKVLKKILSKLIRDKRYLNLLFRVIDANAPGLPLGYYTSPWLGHLYLMEMDNFILQELKPDHYMRYMDNLYIMHRNKRELHQIVKLLSDFIAPYNLHFNKSRQIFRFEYPRSDGKLDKNGNIKTKGRAINCLGFVIHYNRVTLRKGILKRTRAKAYRMSRRRDCRYVDAVSMLSRCGWFKHTDTYNYFQKYIKPNVSIRRCRKRVSAYTRKERKQHDRLENRPWR